MQTQILQITGMNTDQCADHITDTLRALQGVTDVRVSLLRSQAEVVFDERHVNLPSLQETLAQAGYGSSAAQARDKGGCCGGCCS